MKTKLAAVPAEDDVDDKQAQAMAAAWGARQAPAEGDPVAFAPDPPPEDDGCIPVTARLKPSVHDYLVQRARMHGQTPEQHLDAILRAFRLSDPHRPDLARLPPAEPGLPAMARPR